MINQKNATSHLKDHDLDSLKLFTDLLKELRKLHYYWLQVYISHVLVINNVTYYNPFWMDIEILTGYYLKKVDNYLLINFSEKFDRNDKILICLVIFSFLCLLSFLKIGVTFAIFRKEGNLKLLFPYCKNWQCIRRRS